MLFEKLDKSIERKRLYKAEDLNKFKEISTAINFRFREGDWSKSEFFRMGYDDYYNSLITLNQLTFALAMSNNDLVHEISERKSAPDFSPKLKKMIQKEVEELKKAKVLLGMKILDLGCGYKAGFARWTRKFGADVYTADKLPPTKFDRDEKFISPEEAIIEVNKHIEIDLLNKRAAQMISDFSGGEFDLVTEANLGASGFRGGRDIAKSLLRVGGVYASFGGVERRGIKNENGEIV